MGPQQRRDRERTAAKLIGDRTQQETVQDHRGCRINAFQDKIHALRGGHLESIKAAALWAGQIGWRVGAPAG
jgi:hypothetical protein